MDLKEGSSKMFINISDLNGISYASLSANL